MRRLSPAAWALCALVFPVLAASAEPVEDIRALIARVDASDCRFFRNGEWHDAAAAADHLARKLRVARFLGRTGSAEDFIERAGTRSSVSGEAYRVQCGTGPAQPSAGWLQGLLREVRHGDEAPTLE